jgi:hypothetical protein
MVLQPATLGPVQGRFQTPEGIFVLTLYDRGHNITPVITFP